MKKLNSKGFTLIELLAVVVIMGILMIVAIPAVTKYINNSKKDVFIDNANAYINSARYSLLNDEYDCQSPDNGKSVYIPLYLVGGEYEKQTTATATASRVDNVFVDKGNGKSTYNESYQDGSYIQVSNTNDKLIFSVCLVDVKNNGINLKAENELVRQDVKIKTASLCSIPDSSTICKKK